MVPKEKKRKEKKRKEFIKKCIDIILLKRTRKERKKERKKRKWKPKIKNPQNKAKSLPLINQNPRVWNREYTHM
jgi:hypothetical protein